jgi:gas vesicle protein
MELRRIKLKSVPQRQISPPAFESVFQISLEDKEQASAGTNSIICRLKWFSIYLIAYVVVASMMGYLITHVPKGESQDTVQGVLGLCFFALLYIVWTSLKIMREAAFNARATRFAHKRMNALKDGEKQKRLLLVVEMQKRDEELAMKDALIIEKKANHLYSIQSENVSKLSTTLAKIDNIIPFVEQLFSQRAFSPFWDQIEQALKLLDSFNEQISQVNREAMDYYDLLRGHEHTFPEFPVKSESLPNASGATEKLQTIIAFAQRDFQFATIFEQRRTTETMYRGFRNLQEAVSDLLMHIESSTSALKASLQRGFSKLSSDLADAVDDAGGAQREIITEFKEQSEEQFDESREWRQQTAKHQVAVEKSLDKIQKSLPSKRTPI